MDLWDIFQNFPYLMTVIQVVVVAVVAVILERIITAYVRRFCKKREMPPDVANGLVLTSRLLILIGAIGTLLKVGGLPTESFVAFSALGGAAVGFASTRTLGNFFAGLFVFLVRPFRVEDYVRIGDVEGIVEEISINYTKVLTPANTVVLISNQKILDQNITNYRYRDSQPRLKETALYCYNFKLGIGHTLPVDQLEKVFDEVIEQYAKKFPRKPEYKMTRLSTFEREYTFSLYVKNPRKLFTLHPAFLKDVTEAWEKALAKQK